MVVKQLGSLEWPTTASVTVQCAGESFLEWDSFRNNTGQSFMDDSRHKLSDDDDADDDDNAAGGAAALNLLDLPEHALQELSYYEILGSLPLHATTEQIKKAYHKASLKYHPDKTGRGREDELFLKVKAAFEVLGDAQKRLAYDSTLDFDDSIPKGNEPAEEFYETYGPVFQRNLRFDARLNPERRPTKGIKKKRKNNKGGADGPPSFGDDETPVDQVHKFYEYWIHFESWRDFTRLAQEETDKEYGDPENADSRFEKRWIQKEIDKRAKSHKREEMSRLTTLVERAMAADPRIAREKQRERETKERLAKERREKQEREELEKRLRAEQEEREREEREKAEKEARLAAKAQKEKEKKVLRKARQLFRKLCMAAHNNNNNSVWKDMEAMNDDVEYLCEHLTAQELTELTNGLGGADALDENNNNNKKKTAVRIEGLDRVQSRVLEVREGVSTAQAEAALAKQRAREADAAKQRRAKAAAKASNAPWTKPELSALAKAVKKYPAGGANRWGAIALFVNNLCKPKTPRSKEDCIEKYNQIASGAKPTTTTNNAPSSSEAATTTSVEVKQPSAAWTSEQDKQLQEGLAKFPSTMDKNERWSSIAKGVTGKSKKECVQRFKAIREALRQKR